MARVQELMLRMYKVEEDLDEAEFSLDIIDWKTLFRLRVPV